MLSGQVLCAQKNTNDISHCLWTFNISRFLVLLLFLCLNNKLVSGQFGVKFYLMMKSNKNMSTSLAGKSCFYDFGRKQVILNYPIRDKVFANKMICIFINQINLLFLAFISISFISNFLFLRHSLPMFIKIFPKILKEINMYIFVSTLTLVKNRW